MIGLISAMWLAASSALAQDADIDHRRLQDITAFTVPQGVWRVGTTHLDYGLSDRTSIGLHPLYWAAGANVKAKSTVWEGDRVAVSVGATRLRVHRAILATLLGRQDTSTTMSVTSLNSRLSWKVRPKLSVHGGYTRLLGNITGELTGNEIDAILATIIGQDSGISDALGNNTLYASALAQISLNQSNFAIEWRRKETSSWIFESNNYFLASGLVVGTANVGDDTTSGGVGASAVFEVRPSAYLGSASSIAWQRHWERFNLRVGIPLNPANPLSFTQALQFYWLI